MMIERYKTLRMREIWTELNQREQWLKVEAAGQRAKETLGLAPEGIHLTILAVRMTKELLRRADEIEMTIDHDLLAWVTAVSEQLDDVARIYFHAGFTSFDIEDTALMLMLQESLDVIYSRLDNLRQVLLVRANQYRNKLQVGRTHNIHAEPISFGLKLLNWVDVIERHLERLIVVRREISVGKFSGAVGTYVLDPQVEELASMYLGLKPARISTQVLSRDLLVHYASVLVGIANSLDRFATEIRHLAGTDVCEVAEFKRPGSKGSSAMPGKSRLRNPIKSENVCSLAKAARGCLLPALECEVLWYERTLDNSGAERIYLPDLTMLVDFMLQRFTDTMEKLEVFPEQMERNLWRTGGIIFAQRVIMALTGKGMARDKAYVLVEGIALQVEFGTFITENGQTFKDLVYKDQTICSMLSAVELDRCFDPKEALRYLDDIFSRFKL